MMTAEGPKVVEYNCRFGDPETQAVLPLVECDWYEMFTACAEGGIEKVPMKVRDGYCVSVVLASKGYPGSYSRGKRITGIDSAEHSKANRDVYHSGTALGTGNSFVTGGGRVVSVSAWADTLPEAVRVAYEGVADIDFEGKTFRSDIGAKGIARLAAHTPA
jgi:phosphoribosylamine--glycine ligase